MNIESLQKSADLVNEAIDSLKLETNWDIQRIRADLIDIRTRLKEVILIYG